MKIRVIVGGALIGLLAGCASNGADPGETDASSPGPSETVAGADLGSLYTSTWNDSSRTVVRHPIQSDGSLAEPITILDEEADDVDFPGTIDGLGASVLTGSYSTYWTTDVQLRDATTGAVTNEVAAPSWCGGEGLTYNACALLDDTQVARSSELGREGEQDSTIEISSLESGDDVKQLGPFPGLFNILGTPDANTLMIMVSDTPNTDPPEPRSGTVSSVDVSSGTATEIGAYPEGWSPMCAIGSDSVLGYTTEGTPTAVVVGAAAIGDVTWSEDESPVGCTSDGQFLFVQEVSQPPTGEEDDTDSPGAGTSVTRIALSDGSREQVLALEPGTYADLVTR